MNDEISRPLKIHSAANAAAPTAKIASRIRIRRIDLLIYPPSFFKCPIEATLDLIRKRRRRWHSDRLRENKPHIHPALMIGTGVDPIANFAYAEKHNARVH